MRAESAHEEIPFLKSFLQNYLSFSFHHFRAFHRQFPCDKRDLNKEGIYG